MPKNGRPALTNGKTDLGRLGGPINTRVGHRGGLQWGSKRGVVRGVGRIPGPGKGSDLFFPLCSSSESSDHIRILLVQ